MITGQWVKMCMHLVVVICQTAGVANIVVKTRTKLAESHLSIIHCICCGSPTAVGQKMQFWFEECKKRFR
jgi:hypothetical protein